MPKGLWHCPRMYTCCILSLVGRLQDIALIAGAVCWPTHLMIPWCHLLQHIVLVTHMNRHTHMPLNNNWHLAVRAEETVYSTNMERLLTDWLIDWLTEWDSNWLIVHLHWTGCILLCGLAVCPAGRAIGWQRAMAGRTSPPADSQSAAKEHPVGCTQPWEREWETEGAGKKDSQFWNNLTNFVPRNRK